MNVLRVETSEKFIKKRSYLEHKREVMLILEDMVKMKGKW